MAVNDDVKRAGPEKSGQETDPSGEPSGGDPTSAAPDEVLAPAADAVAEEEAYDVAPVAPKQLGTQRYVYAAYFFGAVAIAFLFSKIAVLVWQRLQAYSPAVGEPRDEIVMPVAAILGAGIATYYWYRTSARRLAEEVASEMAKVTWPTRTEVTNGTVVVIVTTVISTVFFALMDKFWGFVTNLVYGGT
jgi:preprotein translocase subunit SecE